MKKINNGVKALPIIHKALLMGQIIFATTSVFIVSSMKEISMLKAYDKTFQVVVLIVAAAGFFIGSFLFKKKISELRNDTQMSVKDKFAIYFPISIVQWALLEAPSLLATISFMLTGNYAFLGIVALLALLMTMQAPSKIKMELCLGCSEEELEQL